MTTLLGTFSIMSGDQEVVHTPTASAAGDGALYGDIVKSPLAHGDTASMLGAVDGLYNDEEDVCISQEVPLPVEPTALPSALAAPKPWLAGLLSADLFRACRNHPTKRKNETKFFCEHCTPIKARGMCKHCIDEHACRCHHSCGFQIRRYMYQNVVHADDLAHRYDIARVQQYSINDRKAVLIHPKAAPATAKTAPAFSNSCRGCAVPLNPEWLYCCLKCKVDVDFGVEPPTPGPNGRTGLAAASYGVPSATPMRAVRPHSAVDFSEGRSSGFPYYSETPAYSTGGSKRRKIDRPQRSHVM